MIVVVTYVTQEDRFGLPVERITLNRYRARRGPPSVEMRSGTSAQPGAPPPAIDAVRGFIVDPADIHRRPLKQERRALTDAFVPPRRELIQEFLMTIDQPRRPCCPELLVEQGRGSSFGHDNVPVATPTALNPDRSYVPIPILL